MKQLYEIINKRKSVRKYNEEKPLNDNDIKSIEEYISTINPLTDNAKIEFKIVKKDQTSAKFGQYCILIYSEKSQESLMNVGYMGEMLDLWLATQNIGACWYGMGKPKEVHSNLDFTIMLTIGRAFEDEFKLERSFKRKPLKQTWSGEIISGVCDFAKNAPSAVNFQPWHVENSDNTLLVSLKPNKILKMVAGKLMSESNLIDMGIYICCLEICLNYNEYRFTRKINSDKTVLYVLNL